MESCLFKTFDQLQVFLHLTFVRLKLTRKKMTTLSEFRSDTNAVVVTGRTVSCNGKMY